MSFVSKKCSWVVSLVNGSTPLFSSVFGSPVIEAVLLLAYFSFKLLFSISLLELF